MRTVALSTRHRAVLAGSFTPPGDKSITHRAALFGMLAAGETRVTAANPGEDCGRSWSAATALGAPWRDEPTGRVIRGAAMHLTPPIAALDCGNSGTTLRLLAGIVASQSFQTDLFGDASLSRRPMSRILEPLRLMGAQIEARPDGLPPLQIRGSGLRGIHYDVPVASAQVATSVLLAGLAASGQTSVTLPGPARDHTERMLPCFGVPLLLEPLPHGGRRITIQGGGVPRATSIIVPGDFSGASFFLAAAAATPGAMVTARGVNLNPTRTGLLDVLVAMGAGVQVTETREAAGEPVGDITVHGPERLRAFDVPREWVPRLIDEAPAWVLLATAAEGISRLCGASELRVKESDRIALLTRNLVACGVEVREQPDGLEITGGPVRGAAIEAGLDHRIVMAFAALGARCDLPMRFDDVSSVFTSYPRYFETLAALGAEVIEGEA
ncbi:MAG: 3-phosphoshikimate 1-carboxyvinyltransferase [Candidatus Eisenbacteria bacterium]